MAHEDSFSWRVPQEEAPDLVLEALGEIVGSAPIDIDVVESDGGVEVTLTFGSHRAFVQLIDALGESQGDWEEYGELYDHDFTTGGGASVVIRPDDDGPGAWLIEAAYAEDIEPNASSWPLALTIGEQVANALGGRDADEAFDGWN